MKLTDVCFAQAVWVWFGVQHNSFEFPMALAGCVCGFGECHDSPAPRDQFS